MKKLFLFLLILLIFSSPIYAIPSLPHILAGDVLINNKPAKLGTEITTVKDGKIIGKIEVTEEGKFKLLLQNLNEGDTINLYVDNINTEQSIVYKSGDFQQLSLKIEKSYLIYYFGVTLLLLIGAGII